MRAAVAVVKPVARTAPSSDCMIDAPRSFWRQVVPDAMPTRFTGVALVSALDDAVLTSETAAPIRMKPTAINQ